MAAASGRQPVTELSNPLLRLWSGERPADVQAARNNAQQDITPRFMGMDMSGSRPGDPVADYMAGNANRHSLESILNQILSGMAAAGSVGSLAAGSPVVAAPLAYAAKNRFDAADAAAEAAEPYMQGARMWDQTGLPGRPGAGRFATMPADMLPPALRR
jgi:hypothetical protein